MIRTIKEYLTTLNKQQSFVIILLLTIGLVAGNFFRGDNVVRELKLLNQNTIALREEILNTKLNNLTEGAAKYIYDRALTYSSNEIYNDMVEIIDANRMEGMSSDIAIREKINQRVQLYFRRDFADLSMYYYDGVPLSFVLREINDTEIIDLCSDYILRNINLTPWLLKRNIKEILDNKTNENILLCQEGLGRK